MCKPKLKQRTKQHQPIGNRLEGGDKAGAPNGSFSENTRSEGLNQLRYSDLIPAKTRDFFSETSSRTFVTRGIPIVFRGTNMSFRV